MLKKEEIVQMLKFFMLPNQYEKKRNEIEMKGMDKLK